MRENYVIACSDEEKDQNYKYIAKKYFRDKKNRNLIGSIILALQSLRLSEPYYFFSEELCGLYIKEIELFYLNNNFCKRRLQIRKAYLIKKNERHYGIILPIFLSLIASIIYGICSGSIFETLVYIINGVSDISLKFFDLIDKVAENDYTEICKMYFQLIMFVVFFIVIMTLLVGWIIIKIIHIISAFLGGINFSKITIKQYEIDYLDKLALNEEYYSLIKEIDTYSNKLFDAINSLTYNMAIKDGSVLVENVICELEKKLSAAPNIIHNDKFSTNLFDKHIIVKSIICRALLNMKEKHSCLVLKRNRIFLKKKGQVNVFKDERNLTMQKTEIVQAVIDYVNNDKAKYAVLINGAWGSGKTYFYEHYLKDEIAAIGSERGKRKTNIYISLYGISSVEQLSKEIFTNYIVEVKLSGNSKIKNIYKKIGAAVGVFSKMFSVSINGWSIDFDKGIDEIKNVIEFKDMVICLDDIERCSIPINELFGMINNLVEHCNCKVIILADEDNIGKMYANTNVEMKYLTLLMGKSLDISNENENKESQENSKNENILTVKELKRNNEEIYSENYIYKDIKEKVIGVSLKYTPNLKDEFETIISDTVNVSGLPERLSQKKEKILDCMDKCRNSNIRIMKTWLINFERIYEVIEKYFTSEQYNKYFDEIFDRFAIYSIRVACALGKNQPLKSWEDGVEVGRVRMEDTVFVKPQGYRFVDDLFLESVFDVQRICHAAKIIVKELQDDEEYEKDSLKRQAYNKLEQWRYLEDEEISQSLSSLVTEIKNNEFMPQDYQNIIVMLVILKQKGFFEEDFIKEIFDILINKLDSIEEKIKIENFRYDFKEQESLELFQKYYGQLFSCIMKKNREIEKQELNQVLDCSNGSKFLTYCYENSNEFLEKKSFMAYVDLEGLIKTVNTGDIREIYEIARGFEIIYNFSNLYEFYFDDLELLNILVDRLQGLECGGKTRKIAVDVLCDTLNKKIETIKSKGERYNTN